MNEHELREELAAARIRIAHLEETQQYHASLLDNLDLAFCVVDATGKLRLMHPKAAQLLGGSPEDFIGSNVADICPIEGKEALGRVRRTLEQNAALTFEDELVLPDGRTCWISLQYKPFPGQDNQSDLVQVTHREVTAERSAREALRRSQSLLNRTQALTHTGSWEHDLVSLRATWSDEFFRILGLPPGDTPPDHERFLLSRVHADDRERVQRDFHTCRSTKGSNTLTFRLALPNGETRVVEMNGEVICDDQNRPIRVLGTLRDVTDRERSEKELRSSERLFRLVADNMPCFVAYLDPERFTYRFVNSKYERAFGKPGENILGQTVHAVLGEQYYVQALPHLEQARSGKATNYEKSVHFPDGKRWLHAHYVPDLDEEGKVRGIVVLNHDITQQKQAQEELERNAAQLRELMSKLPFPLCVSNGTTQTISYVNETFTQAFGYTLSDMPSIQAWWEAFYPDPAYRWEAQQAWFKAKEESEESLIGPQTWRVRCKNGEDKDVEFLLAPKGDTWILAMTDRTAHQREQEALLEAKEQAEAASRAKSEFLANMSHELRTPLNGVMGMLQLMKLTPLTQEQRDYVQIARDSAHKLLTIINDILDLSRIESGRVGLKEEVFNVAGMLDAMCDVFTNQASRKGVELTVSVAPDVPHLVLADATRLRQVLFNLVGNAVKFTDEGEVRLHVSLGSPTRENVLSLEFTVTDTGIGIKPDRLDSVFEIFTQGDGAATRRHGGTGLGLSIVKRLVELMGGGVDVSSQVGKGTRFTFNILAAPAETARRSRTAPTRNSRPLPKGLKILLVDDDAINRHIFSQLLTGKGHSVALAEDGEHCLEILANSAFDVILMDIQMPHMDGVEATRLIRSRQDLAHAASIPVVALTAHAMEGDKERFLAQGMDAYVAKPVDIYELLRVLGKVCPDSSG